MVAGVDGGPGVEQRPDYLPPPFAGGDNKRVVAVDVPCLDPCAVGEDLPYDGGVPARGGLDEGRGAVPVRAVDVGPGLDDILLRVCCLSWGLEAAERELNWPRRSARLVLRIALERLAAHYGLKRRPRPAATRILGWGLPDHVPQHALPPDMEQ